MATSPPSPRQCGNATEVTAAANNSTMTTKGDVTSASTAARSPRLCFVLAVVMVLIVTRIGIGRFYLLAYPPSQQASFGNAHHSHHHGLQGNESVEAHFHQSLQRRHPLHIPSTHTQPKKGQTHAGHRRAMAAQSTAPDPNVFAPIRMRLNFSLLNPPNDWEAVAGPQACTAAGQNITVGPLRPPVPPPCDGMLGITESCTFTCGADDVVTPTGQAAVQRMLETVVVPTLSAMLLVGGVLPGGFIIGECAKIPNTYSVQVAGADLLVYATMRAVPYMGNTIAYALPCHLDLFTRRPNVIIVNVPPATLVRAGLTEESILATIQHEMIHGLGFASDLFRHYKHPANRSATYVEHDPLLYPTGPVSVSDSTTVTMNSDEGVYGPRVNSNDLTVGKKIWFRGPGTLAAARAFFGCAALERGVELENQGGFGTAATHWEARLFSQELMGPQLKTGVPVTLSNITLSLLEDSGWYLVNRSAIIGRSGGVMTFGYLAGCGFVNSLCNETLANPLWPLGTTPRSANRVLCSTEATHKASGGLVEYSQPLPEPAQYFPSAPTTGGWDAYSDYCPYPQPYGPGGDCRLPITSPQPLLSEVAGNSSRCFVSAIVRQQYTTTLGFGTCLRSACMDEGMLAVMIGDTFFPCPSGEALELLYPPRTSAQYTTSTRNVSYVSLDYYGNLTCPSQVGRYVCARRTNTSLNKDLAFATVDSPWPVVDSVVGTASVYGGSSITLLGRGLGGCRNASFNGVRSVSFSQGGAMDGKAVVVGVGAVGSTSLLGGAGPEGSGTADVTLFCLFSACPVGCNVAVRRQGLVFTLVPAGTTTTSAAGPSTATTTSAGATSSGTTTGSGTGPTTTGGAAATTTTGGGAGTTATSATSANGATTTAGGTGGATTTAASGGSATGAGPSTTSAGSSTSSNNNLTASTTTSSGNMRTTMASTAPASTTAPPAAAARCVGILPEAPSTASVRFSVRILREGADASYASFLASAITIEPPTGNTSTTSTTTDLLSDSAALGRSLVTLRMPASVWRLNTLTLVLDVLPTNYTDGYAYLLYEFLAGEKSLSAITDDGPATLDAVGTILVDTQLGQVFGGGPTFASGLSAGARTAAKVTLPPLADIATTRTTEVIIMQAAQTATFPVVSNATIRFRTPAAPNGDTAVDCPPFRAALQPPVGLPFFRIVLEDDDPAASLAAPVRDVSVAATGLTAVGALLSAAPAFSLSVARASAVAGLTSCDFSTDAALPFTLMPLQAPSGEGKMKYLRGGLRGTLYIYAGWWILVLLASLVLLPIIRHDPGHTVGQRLWRALGMARFPSVLAVPVCIFGMGAMMATTSLLASIIMGGFTMDLANSNSFTDLVSESSATSGAAGQPRQSAAASYGSGPTASGNLYAEAAAAAASGGGNDAIVNDLVLIASSLLVHIGLAVNMIYRLTAQFQAVAVPTGSSYNAGDVERKTRGFIFPVLKWVNDPDDIAAAWDNFVLHYSLYFTQYTNEYHAFLALDYIVGLLGGVVLGVRIQQHCSVIIGVYMGLIVLLMLAMFVMRPHTTVVAFMLNFAMLVLTWLGLVLGLVAQQQGSDTDRGAPRPDSYASFLKMSVICAILALVVAIAKLAHDLLLFGQWCARGDFRRGVEDDGEQYINGRAVVLGARGGDMHAYDSAGGGGGGGRYRTGADDAVDSHGPALIAPTAYNDGGTLDAPLMPPPPRPGREQDSPIKAPKRAPPSGAASATKSAKGTKEAEPEHQVVVMNFSFGGGGASGSADDGAGGGGDGDGEEMAPREASEDTPPPPQHNTDEDVI